jgi:hypothetical protein
MWRNNWPIGPPENEESWDEVLLRTVGWLVSSGRAVCSWMLRNVVPVVRRYPRAVVVGCGVLVLLVALTGLGDGDVKDQDASAPRQINVARQPLIVQVRTGSAVEISGLGPKGRRGLARQTARQILPAFEIRPRRVVVVHLRDVPLSFAVLTESDRLLVEARQGSNAAAQYESAIAEFLDDLMDEVERRHPAAGLSVLGLPVEPEEAGVSLATVQQTNDRYHGVIDRLGPFVPTRRFVVLGSSLDEKRLARMGMREAMRLRNGRPIVFQSNRRWQALIDVEADGRDFQIEALLGDDP